MGYQSNETFEALKTFMVNNYGAKIASGGKEIIKRCHICGDSRNKSSRHMYIGLNKDGIIVYNCFKCSASGIVDGAFFRNLGCYDVDMISICNKNNHSNVRYHDMLNKRQIVKHTSPILTYRDAPETQKKVAYLSKRLGYNFSLEDLARFKIVLNLYDFISSNNIGTLTRQKNVCDQIDQFFLGFLSTDNSYINMRRLVPEKKLDPYIDYRYVNYNIYGFQDNSHRYYILPTTIDTSKRITINIAEGAFDILGVYLNTDSVKENAIFASIGGKTYLGIVKFFILEYGIMNFDLHIYVDNDVDNYVIYKVSEILKPMNCRIFMHRNLYPGEKDYGVIRDKIDDKVVEL